MLLLRLSCKSQRANRVVKFVFQCSTIAGVKSGSKRCNFEFGAVFKTLLPADETRKTHSDGGKETVNTHATPRVWAPTQTRGGSPSKKMVTQITSRVTPLTMEQNAYLDGTTGSFRTVRASSATWTHAAPGSCNVEERGKSILACWTWPLQCRAVFAETCGEHWRTRFTRVLCFPCSCRKRRIGGLGDSGLVEVCMFFWCRLSC